MRKYGTCVAYRDGVMAADTLAGYDDLKVMTDIKVHEFDGGIEGTYLIGMSGAYCPSIDLFKSVWFGGEKDTNIGTFDFTYLVVNPNKEVIMLDQRMDPMTPNVPFIAIGSGGAYAMGAMEMGASAEEAVRVAIKWAPGVGGDVKCLYI